MRWRWNHLWNESEIGEQKPAFQQYFVSSILKQEIPQYFSPLHCWLFKLFAWIGSRKILGVKLTKRGLVNNQLLVLATYFLQFKFQQIFPCWNFPRKWFSFDWQQSGAETEMSLSCTSFPSNQCHWVHSELPGAAEILKTESFALIFPLSMSPNMPTCPGHIGVKKLFSKYWQEGSASSKGRAKSCYLFQHSSTFLVFTNS